MQVVSLFSGIGGFEIAAEWMGWDNIVSCEINPFGQQVLQYHYPNAYHHNDIHTLTYEKIKQNSRWNEHADTIICGGFPCQPYSTAGKRLGKEDERHLWPEMLRVISEVAPTYVVGENVRGLISWNGGLVFEEVQTDLEALGYEVQPFLLPACGVDAPHRRDRIWFVAKNTKRDGRLRGQVGEEGTKDGQQWDASARSGNRVCLQEGFTPDTESTRGQGQLSKRPEQGEFERCHSEIPPSGFENFPTQSPICSGNDGVSLGLSDITFPKWRSEAIKALGNAVVPQVVYQIFKAIEQTYNLE